MIHKFFIIVNWACCFFIANQVYAQRVCVVNAKMQALPLTHFIGCDQGAVTDASGCIDIFPCDSIFISSVGYLDTVISGKEKSHRTIFLKEQTYPLPLVRVTSTSEKIEKSGNSLKYYFGLKKPKESKSKISFPYIEIAQVFQLSTPCSELIVRSIGVESLQKLKIQTSLLVYSISGDDTLALGPRVPVELRLRRRKVAKVDFDKLKYNIPENHSGKCILVSLSFDTRQLKKDIRLNGSSNSKSLNGNELLIAVKSMAMAEEKIMIRYSAVEPFRLVDTSATIFGFEGVSN